MGATRTDIYSEIEDGVAEELDVDEIVEIECKKCGNEWTPSKHPKEMNKLTCSNNDCQQQSKRLFEVTYETDEPEDDNDSDHVEENTRYRQELEEEVKEDVREPREQVYKNPVEKAAEEFEEFLLDVSDRMGGKLNEDFVSMAADNVKEFERLPTTKALAADLSQASSGVSNDHDIDFIRVRYERWLEAKQGKYSGQVGLGSGLSAGGSGGYGQASGNQSGWGIPVGGGQQPRQGYGQGGQPGGQPQHQHPQHQPPQQGYGQGGQPGGQTPPWMDELKEVIEEQQRQIESLKQQVNQDNSGNDIKTQLEEFREMQETLESMMGDDSTDASNEQLMQLQRQVSSLKQQMDSGGPGVRTGDSEADVLLQLAQQDDVDSSTLTEVVDRLRGPNDPSIREKEIEKQIRQMELEHESSKVSEFSEVIEGLGERIGHGIGSGLAGGGDDGGAEVEQQPPQDFQQQPSQQPPQDFQQEIPADFEMGDGGMQIPDEADMDVETWDCPNCGEEIVNDPRSPGIACPSCDYSLDVCMECSGMVAVPPKGEPEMFQCPKCAEASDIDGDPEEGVACDHCEWDGDLTDAPAEMVECGDCGEHLPVMRSQPPSMG